MLKTIERTTGVRIAVEKVPTVADLHARRLELTRAALRESLLSDSDEFEHFRSVIDSLSDEFDIVEVALAAVKLAHEATTTAADDEDIPEVPVHAERPRTAPVRGCGRRRAVSGAEAASRVRHAAVHRTRARGRASGRRTSSAPSPARPA